MGCVAQSEIDPAGKVREDLGAKAAVGLVTIDELRGMELGLSAVQAKAELALQEIEILKTIR